MLRICQISNHYGNLIILLTKKKKINEAYKISKNVDLNKFIKNLDRSLHFFEFHLLVIRLQVIERTAQTHLNKKGTYQLHPVICSNNVMEYQLLSTSCFN